MMPGWLWEDSLFSGDVPFKDRGAVHLGHLHVALDLPELQAQVLPPDGDQRAPLPGPSQRADLWAEVTDGSDGGGVRIQEGSTPRHITRI